MSISITTAAKPIAMSGGALAVIGTTPTIAFWSFIGAVIALLIAENKTKRRLIAIGIASLGLGAVVAPFVLRWFAPDAPEIGEGAAAFVFAMIGHDFIFGEREIVTVVRDFLIKIAGRK